MPMTVEQWAEELPDRYVECRDFGHSWRAYRAWPIAGTSTYGRILRCPRCKVEREQTLDRYGHIVTGHYDYRAAPGYLAPKGAGRTVSRDDIRLTSTLRIIERG